MSLTAESTSGERLSPLLLAEQIDPALLTAQHEYETTGEHEWNPARRNWRQAWARLELVTHPATDDHDVADYLDDIDVHLDRIEGDPDTTFATQFDAGLLEAYKPLMIDRHDQYDRRTMRQRSVLARSIADLINRAGDTTDHDEEARGRCAKAGFHLVFNRSELELFAASAREGHNPNPDLSPLNHDGYVISDQQKVPIKWRGSITKTNGYEPRVLYLPYRSIVMRSLFVVAGPGVSSSKRAVDLAPLLVAEAQGERLDGWELDWVDKVTESVAQAVTDFSVR